MNPVHYSSKSVIWSTPRDFFEIQDAKFGFTLDVCALPENAKCEKYFTPEIDGLKQSWQGERCWMNPPYGRGVIDKWVEKAFREVHQNYNCFVVGLLPARTDTKWFHRFIYGSATVHFIEGRLKFGGSSNAAPFPSMLVIWR